MPGKEQAVSTDNDDMKPAEQAGVTALPGDGAATGRWVLDPAGSRAEFHVKHFWGAITVHGSFGQITGEGIVGADGTITGRLVMDAESLSTRNKQRDKHLRSADFFNTEHHREVVLTVTGGKPAGPRALACQGTLEAAGHVEPVEFTAHVEEVSENAVTLRAELVVDRTKFGMTWSPLHMTSAMARGTVVARFVRP